jgi:hypothetical protein
MPISFITEDLKTIRRRVGALMFDNTQYAVAITEATSITTLALGEVFKRYPDGTFTGRNVYQTSSGQQRIILTHAQSGSIGWTPGFSSSSVGEELEIWPIEVSPIDVKDAINMAIQRVARVFNVYVETANPTLDSTRQIITLPTTYVKVCGLRYFYNTQWLDFRPGGNDWLDTLGGPTYILRGNKLYLNTPINSGAAGTDIYVLGYRLPVLLAADADVSDVPSDYLTLMAAAMLDLGEVSGQVLDPENHEGRAANWLRDAMYLEARLMPNWHPSTQEVMA